MCVCVCARARARVCYLQKHIMIIVYGFLNKNGCQDSQTKSSVTQSVLENDLVVSLAFCYCGLVFFRHKTHVLLYQ